jgi:hypothetical protein
MSNLSGHGRKMTWRERYDKAHEAARRYDKRLRAEDFKSAVLIMHQDGSHMFYRNAFALRYLGMLIVFTEHHRWYVFDPEDLHSYSQFKPQRIGKLKGHEVEYEILED